MGRGRPVNSPRALQEHKPGCTWVAIVQTALHWGFPVPSSLQQDPKLWPSRCSSHFFVFLNGLRTPFFNSHGENASIPTSRQVFSSASPSHQQWAHLMTITGLKAPRTHTQTPPSMKPCFACKGLLGIKAIPSPQLSGWWDTNVRRSLCWLQPLWWGLRKNWDLRYFPLSIFKPGHLSVNVPGFGTAL